MEIFVCKAIIAFSGKTPFFNTMKIVYQAHGEFGFPCRGFGPVEELLAYAYQLSQYLYQQDLRLAKVHCQICTSRMW